RFIDSRFALSLMLDQRAKGRRPMQHGGMGEMKNVVESKSISIRDVVRQGIADKDTIPAEIAPPVGALRDLYFEILREPLFGWEISVKIRQSFRHWLNEAAASLSKIHLQDRGKRNPSSSDCLNVGAGEIHE